MAENNKINCKAKLTTNNWRGSAEQPDPAFQKFLLYFAVEIHGKIWGTI